MKKNKRSTIITRKKRYGALSVANVLSIACLAHCALTPIILIVFPISFAAWFKDYIFVEYALVGVSVFFTIRSGIHSYKYHHHKIGPLLLVIPAMLFIAKYLFLEKENENELSLLIGVSLLVLSQLLNYILCRNSDEQHSHHQKKGNRK